MQTENNDGSTIVEYEEIKEEEERPKKIKKKSKEPKEEKKPREQKKKLNSSNYMITINTNKSFTGEEESFPGIRSKFKDAIDLAFELQTIVSSKMIILRDKAIKRGDKFDSEFIKSINVQKCIEIGPDTKKLHSHVLLSIKHYTLVAIDLPTIKRLFMTSLKDWYKEDEGVYCSYICGRDSKANFEFYIKKNDLEEQKKQALAKK